MRASRRFFNSTLWYLAKKLKGKKKTFTGGWRRLSVQPKTATNGGETGPKDLSVGPRERSALGLSPRRWKAGQGSGLRLRLRVIVDVAADSSGVHAWDRAGAEGRGQRSEGRGQRVTQFSTGSDDWGSRDLRIKLKNKTRMTREKEPMRHFHD